MTFYKWLAPGAVGPYTGFRWLEPGVRDVGEWHDASARGDLGVKSCRSGVHACRLPHLPYWVQAELWTIELGGPVVEGAFKAVAPRGRLLARVDSWEGVGSAYALWSAQRGADFAAGELEAAGLADAAERVRQARQRSDDSRPDAWVDADATSSLAGELIDALRRAQGEALSAGQRAVQRTCAYAEDGLSWLAYYPPAAIAEVAVRTRASRPSVAEDDPAAAERSVQAMWLADRLGLAD